MSYIEREAVLDRLAKANMDTCYGFTAYRTDLLREDEDG